MTTNAARRTRIDTRLILCWMLTAIVASIVAPAPAYAYLDPATGSMIIQIVSGAVLGVVLIVKTYWRRIKGFFSSDSSDTTNLTEETRRPPHDHE
jgi:hypothetical protein